MKTSSKSRNAMRPVVAVLHANHSLQLANRRDELAGRDESRHHHDFILDEGIVEQGLRHVPVGVVVVLLRRHLGNLEKLRHGQAHVIVHKQAKGEIKALLLQRLHQGPNLEEVYVEERLRLRERLHETK